MGITADGDPDRPGLSAFFIDETAVTDRIKQDTPDMLVAPSPDIAEMLTNANDASVFLKRLAHPSRLMIVCALVDGERSVRDLEDTLDLRQPSLSQQLTELREAGMIKRRQVSKSAYYSLADARIQQFVTLMHSLFCASGQSGRA